MAKITKVLTALCLLIGYQAFAATASQLEAKKLLERISGTKVALNHPLLQPVADKLAAGDKLGAAQLATNHPNFLNITVKLMALNMSTREETMRLPLNDFAAMFIGVTRDQTDARELLSGNFEYVADATKIPAGVTIRSNVVNDFLNSNNHFADVGTRLDIGASLVRLAGQRMQGPTTGTDPNQVTAIIMNPDPAGVLTSRSFMMAHASAGTNRRLVEYTFREFMCSPIENWADLTVSDVRIGRDIDRFPGGDHQKFLTSCKACHTVMDGFRGAFAKWETNGDRVTHSALRSGGSYDANGVANKMNKNSNVFPDGYVMTNDSFINNAKGASNAALFGWRELQVGGNGVKQFGELVANSKRFSQCMVKRTYEAVCRKSIDIKSSASYVDTYATRFEQSTYNLKRLFQEIAISQECQ